jgi:hypothetical protein
MRQWAPPVVVCGPNRADNHAIDVNCFARRDLFDSAGYCWRGAGECPGGAERRDYAHLWVQFAQRGKVKVVKMEVGYHGHVGISGLLGWQWPPDAAQVRHPPSEHRVGEDPY